MSKSRDEKLNNETTSTYRGCLCPVGAGCKLKFGDDIELIAPNVTAREMAEVTQRTGIQFPVGATGLGYMFFGSGIDDALAIKVLIPEEKKSDFLKTICSKVAKKTNLQLNLEVINPGGT